MDLLSIIGILGAVVLFVVGVSLETDPWGFDIDLVNNFLSPTSAVLVVGLTFMCLMLMFPAKVFASLPKMLGRIFMPQKFNPQSYIGQIVDIAQDVRKNGLLSIDDKIPSYKDEFMKKGLQLAVDSIDPEMIRDIMETELGFMVDRHKLGIQFNERGAALAPAFGMIGTLIGLINMLGDMDDPSALMENMGVALITTIYGCLLANVFFLPFANKLQKRSDEEVLCKQIVIEGVIAIVNGENPKQIREKLVSYIPPHLRSLGAGTAAGAGGE
ncbi:MAG: motility protein A [Oscillospiraceae bacterium]|nr:motility protein A [Oscillospiraceae bacterium]